MKQLIFVVSALSFSLSHTLGFGIEPIKPAFAQVFRCSDESLGEDEREETRGEDSRQESRVTIGTNCRDANFHEYLNEQDRREEERSKRFACEAFGINSPRCTHEGLKRQAQQEQEQERQRQLESARIQQQVQRENSQVQQETQREESFKQNVEKARKKVRESQESIIFWSDRPDMRQRHEKELPLAEADLQRAEQELQSYLNQRSGR